MVMRDDTFGSIVAPIREGRAIFRTIQKFVVCLLSYNLSDVLIVGLATLAGLPLPLLPLQILFLNLVTDVFPAFALGAGEGHHGILRRHPRDPFKPMITRRLWVAVGLHSLGIIGASLAARIVARDVMGMDQTDVVTVSFLTLAFAQLWHVFNMRDPRSPLIRNEVTRNPFIRGALGLSIAIIVAVMVAMLSPKGWALIPGMRLLSLVAGRSGLIVTRRLQPRRAGRRHRAPDSALTPAPPR